MKLVLTMKEALEIKEMAVKMHHATGKAMMILDQEIDKDVLGKTDKEVISSVIEEAKIEMAAIGGKFEILEDGSVLVDVPEELTLIMLDRINKSTDVVMPIYLRGMEIAVKHKDNIIKCWEFLNKCWEKHRKNAKDMAKSVMKTFELETFAKEVAAEYENLMKAEAKLEELENEYNSRMFSFLNKFGLAKKENKKEKASN